MTKTYIRWRLSELFSTLLLCTPLLACGQAAYAQPYPAARPLRILTSQPGSGSDVMARLIGERLPASFEQRAIVDNRGILAPEIAARAAPDGYTVLFYSTPMWVSPLMQSQPHWDALRDFAPVTLAANAPNLLVVHPSLPVKTVAQLVALAKARPGELNYGSGSAGSSSHLAAELFNAAADTRITRIPYRGVGPALLGLLGGQVEVLFPSASSALSHVKAMRLRALAITSTQPSPLLPGLPTVAAAGFQGYEADTPLGVFMPAGTPTKIVERLHEGIANVLLQPEARAMVAARGADVVVNNPTAFAAWLKTDVARWQKLIRDKGLRGNR
jgi:tripartite-type tricarboxylate transporter receptor subunit TctC